MMRFNLMNKNLLFFTGLIVFYSVIMLLLIHDTPSEIGWDYYAWQNIASKYADGHFKEALNAYWSPLMIWLMIPLVKWNLFDHKEVLAVNYVAGVFLILLAFKIAKQYLLSGVAKIIFILSFFLFAISIQTLYYDFLDFLSAVCLVAYIVFISDQDLKTKKNYFYITSTAAVLCIFSKSFYTYFIFIHLIVLLFYHYVIKKRGVDVMVTNILKTVLVVFITMVIWASLLSWKYERFIISSSGTYNFTMITPHGIGEHFGFTKGLFPPPDSYTYYHWTDPTYYPVQKREIFKNAASVNYNLQILKYNFRILNYTFSYISYFKVGVFLFLLLAFLLKNKINRENMLMYFGSSILIMFGYTLLLIEERYFCGVQILLFVASFISANDYFGQQKINNKVRLIVLFIVFVSFMKFTHHSYLAWKNRDKAIVENTLLYENKIAKLSFMKNKRIATSLTYIGIGDLTCFEICKKTSSKNYGSVGKYDSEEKQYEQLLKFKIDYFLYFGCSKVDKGDNCISKTLPYYLKNKVPVYVDSIYGVSIYSLTP